MQVGRKQKKRKNWRKKSQNEDASALPWLQKFIAQTPPGTENDTNDAPSEGESIRSQQTAEPVKKIALSELRVVKRRLQRHISDFDKITRIWAPRNSHRNELIAKAASVFDYIIDIARDGPKISSVLAHLTDYERDWERFPMDRNAISSISYGKLNGRSYDPKAQPVKLYTASVCSLVQNMF